MNEAINNTQVPDNNLGTKTIAAERMLLSSLMSNQSAIEDVVDVVKPEHFSTPANTSVYKIIKTLFENKEPVNSTTVVLEATKNNDRNVESILTILKDLAPGYKEKKDIFALAGKVKEYATLRKVANLGQIMKSAESPAAIPAFVEKIESLLDDIKHGRKLAPAALSSIGAISDAIENEDEAAQGIKTPYFELNRLTDGLQGGQLIIVGGRPSIGKSAFATSLGEHVSMTQNKPVILFSLEMSKKELVLRTYASRGGINPRHIKHKKMTSYEQNVFSKLREAAKTVPLYINDDASLNLSALRRIAKDFTEEKGPIAMIIVDYLQLLAGSLGNVNATTVVGDVSRGLKMLAKELNIPILGLAQLNRDTEKRKDKRPLLSDLRDSGNIEQDADTVIFIHRDSLKAKIAEVIVAKNRGGTPGSFFLTYDGAHYRFDNPLPSAEELKQLKETVEDKEALADGEIPF